ncbi:MAG: hypothetical protein IPG10_01975 [Flavobacteriales bacterium]|nr:hypothetical protein [Flavobacteriales bacterium]
MGSPRLSLLALPLLFSSALFAQHYAVDTTWWMTDGPVNDIAEDTLHDRVVLGGEFTRLLPPYPTAHGGVVDINTGIMRDGDVRPDDRVKCVLSDGSGGWYVGGDFLKVAGSFRQHLAHLLADGSLAPWNPVVNGAVNAMAIKGDTLYFGGNFTVVNGQSKSNLAAVRLSTGANVVWGTTLADDVVRTMAIDGGDLFVGGDFTSVSGVTRNRIAVYNTSTHVLTGWTATVGGPVHAFGFEVNVVMIGGDFTTVNGLVRSRLARFDRNTAALQTWNPGPNGTVRCMEVSGANIYIGGDFTMINANERRHLALVHSGGGTSTTWVNNTDAPVHSMRLATNYLLLVGGEFDRVAGDVRHRAAALGTQGAPSPWLRSWAPAGDGTVRCMDVQGSNVFLGGGFDTLGLARARVAMLDNATGAPLPWSGNLNGPVYTIEVTQVRTYFGGSFDSVLTTGALRKNLVSFENGTGALATWAPETDAYVSDLEAHGAWIYVAGTFDQLSGVPCTGFVQIDTSAGGAGPMNVDVSYPNVLHLVNDTLYLGGSFSSINGVSRNFLGAVKVPSGTLTSCAPYVFAWDHPYGVYRIAHQDSHLYLAGTFGSVNGELRQNFACVNTADGALLDWQFAGGAYSGPMVPGSGVLHMFPLASPYKLRAVDLVSGASTGGSLAANSYAKCVLPAAGEDLLMGGLFTEVGGAPVAHFAKVVVSMEPQLRVILDGPFVAGDSLMRDDLRVAGLIPNTEPYTALGYTHTGGGGGEVAWDSLLFPLGGNAAVDWVLLELRDPQNPATVVASKSAIVQRDGDVVDADGTNLSGFGPDPEGSYYLSVRHRNHLGVMTATPIDLSQRQLIDFAVFSTATYGVNARKLNGGRSTLWSGDVNFNGQVKYAGGSNDRDPILVRIGGTVPNNTVNGYYQEDVNMNGVVKYAGSANDRDPILVNIGGITPNAVRNAQVP